MATSEASKAKAEETTETPVFYSKAKRQHRNDVLLSNLVFSKGDMYSHRLEPRDYESMAFSLAQEGQLEEIVVVSLKDAPKEAVDKDRIPKEAKVDDLFLVVAGHARVQSMRAGAAAHYDNMSEDMKVACCQMIDATAEDLLVESMATNTQRKQHSQEEILFMVSKLEKAKVPLPRARAAVGYGESQYKRFKEIVNHPKLWDFVIGKAFIDEKEIVEKSESGKGTLITMTKVLDLLDQVYDAQEKGIKGVTVESVVEGLTTAITEFHKKVTDRRNEKEENGKKPPAGWTVDKEISNGLIKHWKDQISKGQPLTTVIPTGKDGYKIGFDEKEKKMTVPGGTFKLPALSYYKLFSMEQEFKEAIRRIAPFLTAAAIAEGQDDDEEFKKARAAYAERQKKKHEAALAKKKAEEAGIATDEDDNPDREKK